ncbi:uncharacterized protein LOC113971395 isoform X2 [Neopelma chrysocephalum]|uniref:uncharacterized protein LOC113971395 isoform X2 n=1 Tax=Neopelma chrysocephalum TaxID=114329 RepID=UPI000FCD052E|nr:uncharacterized protein LOC113971395 isoform X2 [Neopelma chrysocephalum]
MPRGHCVPRGVSEAQTSGAPTPRRAPLSGGSCSRECLWQSTTEMPKEEETNPKSQPTEGPPRLQRRQNVDLRQPQEEQHCPARLPEAQEAAKAGPAPALGEQAPAAGPQSRGPAPHSPCPLPTPLAAHVLGGQRAGTAPAAPETEERALAKEEGERKLCSPRELQHGEDNTAQELSEGELSGQTELFPGEDSSDQRSPHESWERITIHTIWVNPQYAELLQKTHTASQEQAEAAAPSDLGGQVPAAGSQSQVSARHSSYCLSSSSSALLSAQTLSEQQGSHMLQPSHSRRALQTLCSLFWCSCTAEQPQD